MKSSYTPTQWNTAADKVKFENQYKKFVIGGFRREDFPKWFYQRLSQMFGHIAHYNQDGFYEEFFTTPEDRRRFMDQHRQWPCHGDPAWTWSDVERVLQNWIREEEERYEASQDAHP